MQLINDTLKVNGKWSQKRLMTFSSFWVAVVYVFTPAVIHNFEVKEFVFVGFICGGGWALFRTQKKNENIVE